jgi:hypothetical protein
MYFRTIGPSASPRLLIAAAAVAALIAFSGSEGAVHQLEVRHHRIPSEALSALGDGSMSQKLQRMRAMGDEQTIAAAGIGSSQTVNAADYALVGSASIGTPAQQFTVAFWPRHSDTYFIGKNANVFNVSSSPTKKKRYDQSASTSVAADGRNFTSDFGDIQGHIITDVLDFGGGVSANARVGVADKVSKWAVLQWFDADAVIGLDSNPNDTDAHCARCGRASNITVFAQIASALDRPIITLYANRSARNFSDWTGALTIGGEDTTNCAAGSYVYAPRVNSVGELALASISFATQTIALNNASVFLDAYNPDTIRLTDSLFTLFVSSTGAIYYPRTKNYQVNCASVDSQPSFTLNLGVDGSAPVTLNPRDYIRYNWRDATCYLNINDYYSDIQNRIELYLGVDFHNSHCVAENLNDHSVGLANVVAKAKP